jgi:hypothetical protein
MTPAIEHTYRWRPTLDDWSYCHLVLEGQTPRATHGLPGRWVWAVCGEKGNPDGTELPGAEHCPNCKRWLRSGGSTASRQSSGPPWD